MGLPMRRFVFVPALAVAVALFVLAGGASWLGGGTGASSTGSVQLGKPVSVRAAATGTTSIRVTWDAPRPPSSAPTTYDVFRYIDGTGTKVCSVSATSPRACTDRRLPPGTTFGYTVEARLGANWMSGQTAPVPATTDELGS
jgi:hypothetical protein